MNKKVQGIIVGGVVVAALGGTLAFLELTGKDPKESSSETSSVAVNVDSEKDPVSLISTEVSNIKEVRVENENGGFILERPASGKSEFNIKELSGINQDVSMKAGTVTDLSVLEAYKLVESNASDLAKYGLTDAKIKFTVVYADGKETKYLVGADSVDKPRYCYFCEEGKNDVYLVLKTRMSGVLCEKEEYVSKSLTPDYICLDDSYGKMTVKRKDLDYDMVFEKAHSDKASLVSQQVMSAPIYASLNVTISSKVTHGIQALTADSCVKIFPTEEDFKTYGIDDPVTEVIYELESDTYDLKIGNPIYKKNDKGDDTDEIEAYYCYITGALGTNCIYTIAKDKAYWAEFMPGEVIAMMTANKIFDLNEVKITADGGISYDFTLDSDGDQEIYWVRKNGELMEDSDPFSKLYLYILSFPSKEIYFKDVTGDPFIKIEIKHKDGGGDTLEFYQDTERRVIVAVNGQPSYRITKAWADVFLDNLGRLDRGEEIKDKP